MLSQHVEPSPSDSDLEQAAALRICLTELGQEHHPDLDAWLAESPAHRTAWAMVQAEWDFIGKHRDTPALTGLRQTALANASSAQRRRLTRARILWPLAAAAALCGAVFGLQQLTQPAVYSTGPGERREVQLADGSRIWLDSSTSVSVTLSRSSRYLALIRGQARFSAVHESQRPFEVSAGSSKVIALGTSFNIELLSSQLSVTLLEGRVRVQSKPPAGGSRTSDAMELSPGEELVLSRGSPVRLMTANLELTQAWQQGRLVLDDEPLDSVIERVSRYTKERILIADPQVAALRISGVFNTTNLEQFVDTLTRYLPVAADRTGGGIVLRHR